jgi:hypothetical protein
MPTVTSPDRLDPLTFAGSFAYLDRDVPVGVRLAAWRSQRGGQERKRAGHAGAGPDLAPEHRTLRGRGLAHRPRTGRGPDSGRNP